MQVFLIKLLAMTAPRRLKIAYLCDMSPLDKNLYSGGNHNIYQSLKRHAGDVTILSNSWHGAEAVRKLMHALPDSLNLRARWRLHLLLGRVIARGVQAELARGAYDVLFGAYSFQSLTGIQPQRPLVTAFTADATPTLYKRSEVGQSFGSFFAPSRYLDPLILRTERRIFQNLDVALWPTEWLKSGAEDLYGLDPAQGHVIPWGANIDAPEPERHPLNVSRNGPVRLLLIGRDWYAKGGPVVFDTLNILRERGIDAHLTVVGCVPPPENMNDFVTVHPQIDKSVPDQLAIMDELLRKSHFLVQPSFESYGFAFCEASAYHLPSICLRVGGVPVRDEVNGHALPLGSQPADFADQIEHYAYHADTYAALRRSTRQEFDARLNWDAWGKSAHDVLQDAVARAHHSGPKSAS